MNLKTIIKITLSLAALLPAIPGFAQVGYIEQDVIKVAGIMTEGQTVGLGTDKMLTTRMYYDGLGRTLQTVAKQASPSGKDMIQPVAYNSLGQQTINYLPYASSASTDGSYHSNALPTEQSAFYNQSGQYLIPVDGSPYSQKLFENSPLQRVLAVGMDGYGFQPGGSGTQHYKTVVYRSNTNTLDGGILMWGPDGVKSASNYTDNTLSVTDGKDEDNVEILAFTDYAGHTILKRQVISAGNYLDTYYVYNNAGMISIVIPPKALVIAATNSYNLTVTAVNNLLFHYAYDTQGRVISKTVPSKGTVNVIYDQWNRLLMMQDANLAAMNEWNYIKYDIKNRAISQGIHTDNIHTTPSAMQSYVDGLMFPSFEVRSTLFSTGYYTNQTFPNGDIVPLAYSYFDNYDLDDNGTDDYHYSMRGLPNEIGATSAPTTDMPTMTLSSTIGDVASVWLLKVIFYDKNLHPIQTQSNNLINYTDANTVTDYTTNVPDFTGQTTTSQTVKNTGTTIAVQTTPTYDRQFRATAISQQTNNANATSAQYSYSEAGQMIQKGLGVVANPTTPANLTLDITNSVASGVTSIQTATNSIDIIPGFTATAGSTFVAQIAPAQNLQYLDYRYNIRGQLVNINNSTLTGDGGHTEESNNSVFGMQLLYNTTDANLTTQPYYNGKLSAVKWMTKDGSGTNGYERAFVYSYDALDRYTKAAYADRPSGSSTSFTANNNWTEVITGYDENGNVNGLNRNASTAGSGTSTAIDNLTYIYDSNNANRLTQVTDATGNNTGFGIYTGGNPSGSYVYDANGNITADPFKNITTTINVLNKADIITINPGTLQNIYYIYDASGKMIRKVANSGPTATTTDYLDGFVYVNGTLSYYPMPEGRMLNNGGTLTPQYVITDQQGNARITFDNTGTGVTAKVIQENSYYGFGMVMPGSAVSLPAPPNKNLYNGGSEIQNDFNNLPDLMQTFYRNYDAALGRWTGVDPQADNSSESLSPYQYAGNNPIMSNDPLGNKVNAVPVVPFNEFEAEQNEFSREQFLGTFGYGGGGAGGPAFGNSASAPGGGGGFGNYAVDPDPIMSWANPIGAAFIAKSESQYEHEQDQSTQKSNSNYVDDYNPDGRVLSTVTIKGDRDGQGPPTYHTFAQQYIFGGTLFTPSNDQAEHQTQNTTTRVGLSSITVGHYKFIANVVLTQTSRNNWHLSIDLYYNGPNSADVFLNTRVYISVNDINFNGQDFIVPGHVITDVNTTYIGHAGYDFSGNNTIGNFTLNIHAGAAIQTWYGASPPLPGAKSDIPIPISKY